ncbi:hypothetical protein SLA2020_383130 [Shorea laevis]
MQFANPFCQQGGGIFIFGFLILNSNIKQMVRGLWLLSRILWMERCSNLGDHLLIDFVLISGEMKSVDPLHFDGWIQALLLYSIRDLDLFIHWDRLYGLPADLFTCETLVVLKLQLSNSFVQLPSRVCLLSLKVLDLHMFYEDDDFGEWFSFGCLALEDLVFQGTFLGFECKLNVSNASLKRLTISTVTSNFDGSVQIIINAPNLVNLNYSVYECNYNVFINLPSITKAWINFQYVHTE